MTGEVKEREAITRSRTFNVKITAPAASKANATAKTSDCESKKKMLKNMTKTDQINLTVQANKAEKRYRSTKIAEHSIED